MAAPWTNRNQSVFVPLNDYTATVIGMVRDNVPFNTVLSADILYIGDGTSGEPAYSPNNNDMYTTLDTNNVDLSVHLKQTTQSSLTGIPSAATAGVITTRGAASAFFVNGTNRAMFRFTMINHLCNDLPTVMDTTRPPDRIRQDVTRSPGGVSTLFLTNCIGCHSGMDPMAQAFAYYNFQYPGERDRRHRLAHRPDRLHRGPNAAEIPHQQHQLSARLQHAGRQLGQPLAHGTQSEPGLEPEPPRLGPRRQVVGPGAREQPGVRELPGDPRVQDGLSARSGGEQRREPERRCRANSVDDQLVPIERLLVAAGVC